MWVRLWVAFSLSAAAFSQQPNTRLHQAGSGFEWGWQLTPGTAAGNVAAVGQYYVKLPQSEQRVLYTADNTGYHGAVAVNSSTHSSTFALGQKAIELHAQQTEPHLQNMRSTQLPSRNMPVDIYLLQQQFGSPLTSLPQQFSVPTPQPEPVNILASATNALQLPNYYYNHLTPLYNIHHHPLRNNVGIEKIESSKPLTKEAKTEQTFVTPIVQVFKDHNCSDDTNNPENVSKELETDLKKSKKLFAEIPSYEFRNINGNFGARNKEPLTYRGQVSFRVETPRPNARAERLYYTTEASYTKPITSSPPYNATEEGINRLVASTQDLITNEDLVRINNAIEQHLRDQSDDLIKPVTSYSARNSNSQETLQTSPTMITVKAKIANILKGEIEQTENNPNSNNVLQSNSNEYRFSSPIVVAEAPDTDFNSQIFDNVVSTIVPYMENGYEFVGIKNTVKNQNQYSTDTGNSEEGIVNVTPRPIGTNYLAPITVALRLLNSNENDTFNYIDDHEAADSELISDTVEKPEREKTVVEIQESIPVSITHINDVEVHEYMDEGRSNNKKDAYDFAKSLYNNYVESVRSSKKIQDNMNKILLYKFGDVLNSQENNENQDSKEYGDSNEQLESSENIQTQVEISPNGENHQRSERFNYYRDDYESDNQKIIQPIIIEKEVPVTKFVDRYIEKQVPYPETVTVPVPVDRPVPYTVEVEKVVEKPVEVTKYVDKPYPVEVPRPYPVEVKVPYAVQQKVYVDRPVHVPYPVEKVVEKSVMQPVAVPTPVAVPVEVPFPVEHRILYPYPVDRPVPVHIEVEKPVDRIVEKQVPVPYAVEKRVPYPVPYETKVPVPYPVERRIPVPVDRIVEKPVTVTKVVEKPVHIQVPVPQPVPVHVHHPYPVDRIVEKRVPYPVHVDRIVEKKVNVPYPVEKIVEKIVEKPVVVTKYVDKPYPVEVKVPYAVEKIVEKRVPYAVHVPVHMKLSPVHQKPDYQVAYKYDYKPGVEETRNVPQYQLLEDNQLRQKPQQHMKALYEEYAKETKRKSPQIQSTQWGNQYASSYQYVNNSVPDGRQPEKNQALDNYVNYLRSGQGQQQAQILRQYQYGHNFGNQHTQPSPNQKDYNAQAQGPSLKDYYGQSYQNGYWDSNKNYQYDVKVRRTDRVPKVTIEYGGFRPPLIPSTEVDLDGLPIKSD